MQHLTMSPAQYQHYLETGCCPQCVLEPLKRGVNLKEGWWLCGLCETWWNLPH